MISTLLTFLLLASSPVFEARTLDGRILVGTVKELTAEQITLETDAGPVAVEMDDLQELTAKTALPPSATAKIRVHLADGSIIVAEQYTARGERATVTPAGGEALDVAVSEVSDVQLYHDPDMADAWAQILAARRVSDLLVLRAGGALDAHPGIVRDVTATTVQFHLDDEDLPVKRTKIYGFVYCHPAGEDPAPPRGFLTDVSGSKWAIRTLVLSERLRWTTPLGLAIVQPLENVARLDLSLGKVLYLSDLQPESVTWTPFFGAGKPLSAKRQFFALRRDKNLESKPLCTGGKTYSKGLALHSRTEVVYRLPDGFRRFQAVAGIDDAVRPQGHVRLVIRGDRKVLWEERITGDDLPLPLDLDISHVRRLTILVDFGENLGIGDYLLLGDARMIK